MRSGDVTSCTLPERTLTTRMIDVPCAGHHTYAMKRPSGEKAELLDAVRRAGVDARARSRRRDRAMHSSWRWLANATTSVGRRADQVGHAADVAGGHELRFARCVGAADADLFVAVDVGDADETLSVGEPLVRRVRAPLPEPCRVTAPSKSGIVNGCPRETNASCVPSGCGAKSSSDSAAFSKRRTVCGAVECVCTSIGETASAAMS